MLGLGEVGLLRVTGNGLGVSADFLSLFSDSFDSTFFLMDSYRISINFAVIASFSSVNAALT